MEKVIPAVNFGCDGKGFHGKMVKMSM